MVNTYNESLAAYNEDDGASGEDALELQNMFEQLQARSEELIEDIDEFLSEGAEPKEEKKSKTGLGWLIFGAAALALTFGAANVFKKD